MANRRVTAQAIESQGLGRALKLARIAAGLSQGAVAERLEVHETTVSAWERGRQRPSDEILGELATLYSTTIDAFYRQNGHGAQGARETPAADRVPPIALSLSKEVRVWLQEFLLELARADVSDREIEEARAVLTAPENATWWKDATPKEMLVALESFADIIRHVLKQRGYKLKAAK